MLCKSCKKSTRVIDSRRRPEGVWRRRECPECLQRFNTLENIYVSAGSHAPVTVSRTITESKPKPKPKAKPKRQKPVARDTGPRKPFNPFASTREDYGSRSYSNELKEIGFDISDDY